MLLFHVISILLHSDYSGSKTLEVDHDEFMELDDNGTSTSPSTDSEESCRLIILHYICTKLYIFSSYLAIRIASDP